MASSERVEQLAAMTRPELVAECDRILARYLADPAAAEDAQAAARVRDPYADPTTARVADFLAGFKRTVGQISTGG